ncbi:tyrosine-type recombinase/integrase [Streptomyces sp. NBC_01005]|uniref:tyrosine-type recombinase/integrase n=1 Tax=unclassified Streptomyces TaxID=2593676 RepID=UPI00386C634F|nr:tyrosine-type recombinase/integrase [Streptomyces sp. NBC_01005]WTC92730.1 tyrosine-type recombinase/integrase [Streptomyces sp. NBC_01650]
METSNYNHVLKDFSHHLDLRDSRGELLLYSRSHRLRLTKATTLINAGAPIHVVQRYLGHLSPEMTMRYANPWELHQTGESSQFVSSRRRPDALEGYYELAA